MSLSADGGPIEELRRALDFGCHFDRPQRVAPSEEKEEIH